MPEYMQRKHWSISPNQEKYAVEIYIVFRPVYNVRNLKDMRGIAIGRHNINNIRYTDNTELIVDN